MMMFFPRHLISFHRWRSKTLFSPFFLMSLIHALFFQFGCFFIYLCKTSFFLTLIWNRVSFHQWVKSWKLEKYCHCTMHCQTLLYNFDILFENRRKMKYFFQHLFVNISETETKLLIYSNLTHNYRKVCFFPLIYLIHSTFCIFLKF